MKQLIRQQALLVLLALVVFLTGLGRYGLFNNGEAMTAAGAAEMLRNHAWIVPTFNGGPETDQPILAWWFMRISFGYFGINEFAARFPSSVLAIGTVLLTYHLGRKLYSPAVGFLAGVIICTCFVFSAYGRAATPDLAHVSFETLAMTSYVWVIAWQRKGHFCLGDSVEITEPHANMEATTTEAAGIPTESADTSEQANPRMQPWTFGQWQWAAPMFVALGMAVLAAGLVGFGLPCATVLLFLLISLRNDDLNREILKPPSGRWWRRGFQAVRQLFRPRRILQAIRGLKLREGIGIVAAIALPWYLSVGVVTDGAWLRDFLWTHNAEHIAKIPGNIAWLPVSIFYDPAVIFLCVFPWSVLLPVAFYAFWDQLKDDQSLWQKSNRLMACWIGVWAFYFLIFGTELPNSILPICPAVALIVGRYLHEWERDEGDSGLYAFNLCCKAMMAVSAIMTLGFYIAAYLYISGNEWLSVIAVVPLIGAFAAIKFVDREDRRKAGQSIVLAAAIFSVLLFGFAPSRFGPYQDAPLFVLEAQNLAKTQDIEIGTYEHFDPSLVFYSGNTVRELKTEREVAEFLVNPHAFVITKATKHNQLRDELRSSVGELSRHRNFLGRDELILLGWQ